MTGSWLSNPGGRNHFVENNSTSALCGLKKPDCSWRLETQYLAKCKQCERRLMAFVMRGDQ